MYNVSVPRSEN